MSHLSHPTRRRLLVAGTLASTLTSPWVRASQAWPSKPMRFVVTFAAGGSTSVFGRLLSDSITKTLGQSMYVDNKAGGGGLIGVDNVAHAPADGYSLVMTAAGPMAITPAMMGDKMPYDPLTDLTPIIRLGDQPNVLVVHESVPADVPGFISWAKESPSQGYATPGVGTTNHITGELLASQFGIKLVHVAYRGSSAIVTDLLGGTIKLAIFNIVDAAPLIRAKKVKPILVTTPRRSPLLPEVPTIVEAGGSTFPLVSWQGMFGPKGLPQEIVDKFNTAFNIALRDPAVMEWMNANGSVPVGGSASDFTRFVASEHKIWGDLVRQYGITNT